SEDFAEEIAQDTETGSDDYANVDDAHRSIENESGVQDLTAAADLAPDAPNEASHPKALQAQRPPQRWTRRKHYKIQEVIKRRQIILVQVVKEERGNKGAAL